MNLGAQGMKFFWGSTTRGNGERRCLSAFMGLAAISAAAMFGTHASQAAEVQVIDTKSQSVLFSQIRYSGSAFVLSPGQEIMLADVDLVTQDENGKLTPNAIIKRVAHKNGPDDKEVYQGIQINVINSKFIEVITVKNFITLLEDETGQGVKLKFADSGETYQYTDAAGQKRSFTVPVFEDLAQLFTEDNIVDGKLAAEPTFVNTKLGEGPVEVVGVFFGPGNVSVNNKLGNGPILVDGKLGPAEGLDDLMYFIWEDVNLETGVYVPSFL